MTKDPLTAEFDDVADWTERAVNALGDDYAIPAACRGSGSPSSLAWLAESLNLRAGHLVLDAGSGVGGPAAWLREHYAVTVIAAEPMRAAAAASRRLFGLPAVVAWSQHLPFCTARFDAAWSLGVLDTVPTRELQLELLTELRRVLKPNGGLGLSVVIRTGAPLIDPPDGNNFPTTEVLLRMLEQAGFATVQALDAASLAGAPVDWQARADRVTADIARSHRDDPAWQQVEEQGSRMARLLGGGELTIKTVHALRL